MDLAQVATMIGAIAGGVVSAWIASRKVLHSVGARSDGNGASLRALVEDNTRLTEKLGAEVHELSGDVHSIDVRLARQEERTDIRLKNIEDRLNLLASIEHQSDQRIQRRQLPERRHE